MMRKKALLLLAIMSLLVIGAATAQLELPESLKSIVDYQNDQSYEYLQNISFLLAFLAGVLSILSPCTLAILPAFFAYTFKEKKEITKMTFTFFSGFSLSFIIMGLVAAFLGKTSLSLFRFDIRPLVVIAGIMLIILGMFSFLGKGFTGFKIKTKPKQDTLGVFLTGILFSIGWSACIGPILAGILLIAAIVQNYLSAAILLFAYSLGIALPLFIIAMLMDKYNLAEKGWLKGREFSLGKLKLHTNKVIAGLLLIALGLLFIIYTGTYKVNELDIFGRVVVLGILFAIIILINRSILKKQVHKNSIKIIAIVVLSIIALFAFYVIDKNIDLGTLGLAELLDDIILKNTLLYNSISLAILIIFIGALFMFLKKRNKP